ncbi:MAG: hypothetical protein DMF69_16905 [Acidobacteria bacterium]|nr:MAG: hypothetical protein DMF69_16905 [Acidobacteriota bacterium]
MTTKLAYYCLITLLVILSLSPIVNAQECAPPAITANTTLYNIFTPEQEMILGELTYQRMQGELRFIRDEQIDAYLNALAQKLIKHLPPTGLKFQFHVVDIPEANAFNIPGGHVFVSRKLVGFANNEDELAGVIAHELGHATVRHSASDFSNYLKQILNVTAVTDRKDITEKYNLLLERERTKKISRSRDHESAQQLEADRIGLFAMVAAGYDANAFPTFFDRLAETKGNTGNWLNDIFGKVKPEQKRLREMIKATDLLPQQCRENRQSVASKDFLNWQASVVSHLGKTVTENLNGLLWKMSLKPGLRSDLSHFTFSPDGKYLLAQDDFSITVLTREPLVVQFQINTPQAKKAYFTPDSQFIVFGTERLRFEKWSVAERKPVEVRDLVVRRSCLEQQFSPDGRFLTCIDLDMNLTVTETQTGKRVWEKKNFYQLNFFETILWFSDVLLNERTSTSGFFNIQYSPDTRHLAVTRSNRYRVQITIDDRVMDQGNSTIVLDLSTYKPLNLTKEFKQIAQRPFVFLDANRILGLGSERVEDSGIFSFPDGKRHAQITFFAREILPSSDPNFVVLIPGIKSALGIFDVSKGKIVTGMNKPDLGVWKNFVAYEGTPGKLILSQFSYNDELRLDDVTLKASIDIPAANVGRLSVTEVSDNFQWLAMSSKTRGAVWELATGERKVFVRGFRGAVMGNDGGGLGDFPEEGNIKHSLVLLNPIEGTAQTIRELPDKGAQQHARFILLREPLPDPKKGSEGSGERSLTSDVKMILRDVVKDNVVWSRDFKGKAPRYFFDKFSGRLIFYWTLGSDAGKERLKLDPTLAAKAKTMGNKDDDYLLEVVDAFAAKTVGSLLLETGKGSFDIETAYSESDWLVLRDSENRVLAYSITDGELKHRFFGSYATINPRVNEVVVENYPGELTFYNLSDGERVGKVVLPSETVLIRFSLDGKRMFVLTEQQTAYAFDVDKIVGAKPTAPTN